MLCVLVALHQPPYLAAHELRPVIATAAVSGERATVSISLDLEAAIAGLGAGHDASADNPAAMEYVRLRNLPAADLRAEFGRLAADFAGWVTFGTAGGPLSLEVVELDIPETNDPGIPRISRVLLEGPLRSDLGGFYWRVDPRLGDSVIRIRERASGRVVIGEFVAAGETSRTLGEIDIE